MATFKITACGDAADSGRVYQKVGEKSSNVSKYTSPRRKDEHADATQVPKTRVGVGRSGARGYFYRREEMLPPNRRNYFGGERSSAIKTNAYTTYDGLGRNRYPPFIHPTTLAIFNKTFS